MKRCMWILQSGVLPLVVIPLGILFITMFMSAAGGNRYLFLSSCMNFDHFEPWGKFAVRWCLWIIAGAAICTFKIFHCPKGLKWLGWWNLVLIYGALFTGYKQDHEPGEYILGPLVVSHLAVGGTFLLTCWVETCTVWYPNTIFTWMFGASVLAYIIIYGLNAFILPLDTGIPFLWNHPELVGQHVIVIVAFVTQCAAAPAMKSSKWAPRTWCFSCLCPRLGCAGDDEPRGAEERKEENWAEEL